MALVLTRKTRKKYCRWYKNASPEQTDYLQRRSDLKQIIDARAENGQVAIVYGFTDCDGGYADNLVTLVNANVVTVERWETRFLDNAEGRTWWNLAAPSEVRGLEEEHRDLALEAFEGGHSHVLYL